MSSFGLVLSPRIFTERFCFKFQFEYQEFMAFNRNGHFQISKNVEVFIKWDNFLKNFYKIS